MCKKKRNFAVQIFKIRKYVVIISIETATDSCSLVATYNAQVLKQFVCYEKANHARQLPLFADECLRWMRDEGIQLDAVALSMGPGSYTGLRIGTSVAKGICYGLDIPLIPIDTLRAMAWKAYRTKQVASTTLLCPMIDARRMEVYMALYVGETAKPYTTTEARVIEEDSFKEELAAHQICFFGNGAAKCKQILAHPNAVFLDAVLLSADAIAQLTNYLLQNGQATMLDVKQQAYFEPF